MKIEDRLREHTRWERDLHMRGVHLVFGMPQAEAEALADLVEAARLRRIRDAEVCKQPDCRHPDCLDFRALARLDAAGEGK